MITEVKNLFAFWRYSSFPYVLGGEIKAIDDNGNVKAKTYGGSWFKPINILSIEAGKKTLGRY